MNELKDIHSIIEGIASKRLYINHIIGDRRLMAALVLYFQLSYQYDFANYALNQARTILSCGECRSELKGDARDCIVLFELEHAILSYNSCYDTILQIVYFAFHFADDFSTKEEYRKRLSDCKWISRKYKKDENGKNESIECGIKSLLRGISPDQKLGEKLVDFYEKDRKYIRDLSNIIKHQGGISINSLNTYIPDVKHVKGKLPIKRDGNEYCYDPKSSPIEVFDPKILYQECIDLDGCISELIKQNNYVFEFVQYLYEFMGLEQADKTTTITMPFYYDCNGKEQTK